jgi:phage terminase large subunit
VIHTIPYTPRGAFKEFHNQTKRWSCLVAHRRAGKTVAATNHLLMKALQKKGNYAYISPYRSQAKAIVWDYLKHYCGTTTKQTNESELTVELVNGSKIRLFGADNSDGMRGLGFDGVFMDEYGDFKPSVWGNVIRPTLSATLGFAVFGSTPKGKNGFWEIKRNAETDPDWYLLVLPASKSGLLAESELQAAKKQLSKDQYEQEYECSFEASLIGAYYGDELRQAQDDGRICKVDWQEALPVHTAWDLGYKDDTAVWFYQVVKGEIHVIDYYAVSGASIEDIVAVIKDKPYKYGKHQLPHDARAKTLASGGKSIIEQLATHLGINNLGIVPNLSIQDGIQAVRMMLPRVWFHMEHCRDGIEALRQYQRDYDEDKKTFRQSPRHDWTSHPADAFRMMAIAWREEPKNALPDPTKTLYIGDRNEVSLNDLWSSYKPNRSKRI